MREGCIDLLAEAACRTLVLGRLLVELGHFSIELVHFGFVDACSRLAKLAALLGIGGTR